MVQAPLEVITTLKEVRFSNACSTRMSTDRWTEMSAETRGIPVETGQVSAVDGMNAPVKE